MHFSDMRRAAVPTDKLQLMFISRQASSVLSMVSYPLHNHFFTSLNDCEHISLVPLNSQHPFLHAEAHVDQNVSRFKYAKLLHQVRCVFVHMSNSGSQYQSLLQTARPVTTEYVGVWDGVRVHVYICVGVCVPCVGVYMYIVCI